MGGADSGRETAREMNSLMLNQTGLGESDRLERCESLTTQAHSRLGRGWGLCVDRQPHGRS
jgi:hypothetical protein